MLHSVALSTVAGPQTSALISDEDKGSMWGRCYSCVGVCVFKCSMLVWNYIFLYFCEPEITTARKWEWWTEGCFWRGGWVGRIRGEVMERWGEWGEVRHNTGGGGGGGGMQAILWWKCFRPPVLPVKAFSVSPQLWCFPWGLGPGSELAEQINSDEVLTLATLTPLHMYTHTS